MKILDALGVDDDRWTEIMTIAREAGERGWWESNRFMGERQALYANLEAGAQTIREFQMTFIPGLLQTPEFTRARNEADRLAGTVTFNADKAADGRVGPAADAAPARRARVRGHHRRARHPPGHGAARGAEGAAVPHRRDRQRQPEDHARGSCRSTPPSKGSACPARRSRSTRSATRAIPRIVAVDTVTDDLLLTEDDDVKRYDELYERLRDAVPVPVGQPRPAAQHRQVRRRLTSPWARPPACRWPLGGPDPGASERSRAVARPGSAPGCALSVRIAR